MRVSWLNLHVHIPIRDVRKLIYSLLDACDQECVEVAHGVRKIVTLSSACTAASNGHLSLVKYLAMSATPWYPQEIVIASLKSDNEAMIDWACTSNKMNLAWVVREEVMSACFEKGFFTLAQKLRRRNGMPLPQNLYHWCAFHNNLDYALAIHKEDPLFPVPYYYTLIDIIIDYTSVRFFRWAFLIKKITVDASQMERAVEKWPELGRRPEKRIKL